MSITSKNKHNFIFKRIEITLEYFAIILDLCQVSNTAVNFTNSTYQRGKNNNTCGYDAITY